MISSVDTDALVGILLPMRIPRLIDKAYADGTLVICNAVYSELAALIDSVCSQEPDYKVEP